MGVDRGIESKEPDIALSSSYNRLSFGNRLRQCDIIVATHDGRKLSD